MRTFDDGGSVAPRDQPRARAASNGVAAVGAIAVMMFLGGAALLGMQSCAQTPDAQAPASTFGQQPLQQVDPQPQQVHPQPESVRQPQPVPQPQPQPQPEPFPQPDPQPDPQPFPDSPNDPKPQPKPKPQPRPEPRPYPPPPT